MKSPDEIKKLLEYMSITNVGEKLAFLQRGYTIPYGYTVEEMCSDALALVQQLQAENSEKDARIQQLEAERDAAVADLKKAENENGECFACKWYNGKSCTSKDYKNICSPYDDKWEWRGGQKEETP